MTPKNRIIEGKIGLRGEGGVKNDSKKSDIIYEWSLMVQTMALLVAKFQVRAFKIV